MVTIFRLPDDNVGGRKVADDGSSRQSGVAGGRDGNPDVLAHLDKKTAMRQILYGKNDVGAEGRLLPAEGYGRRECLGGRAELPPLVEFPVVGEVGFDGYPEDASAVEDHPAVKEAKINL